MSDYSSWNFILCCCWCCLPCNHLTNGHGLLNTFKPMVISCVLRTAGSFIIRNYLIYIYIFFLPDLQYVVLLSASFSSRSRPDRPTKDKQKLTLIVLGRGGGWGGMSLFWYLFQTWLSKKNMHVLIILFLTETHILIKYNNSVDSLYSESDIIWCIFVLVKKIEKGSLYRV